MRISSIKGVGKTDRIKYGKQKVKRFKERMIDLVATACDFNKEECTDIARLINAMPENIDISTKQEQVQIFTITPESWLIKRTCQEFEVSEHLVRKARKLRYEKGLLAKPDAKNEQQIPQNITEKTKYLNYVLVKKILSVFLSGKKIQKQKHLILRLFKKMYQLYLV